MASLLTVPSIPFLNRTPRSFKCRLFPSATQLKNGLNRRFLMVRVRNCSSEQGKDTESDTETASSSSSVQPSSSPSISGSSVATTSADVWCAGIGAVGFLETAYLTYTKLSNSDAFCPVGGGTCGDVLNSDYAVVFGVPLPLLGMFAYGLVAIFSLQLSKKELSFGIDETSARKALLGLTTSMAGASGYFLFILGTKFTGVSCSYCLASVLLSFTLFFITLKNFGLQEIREILGVQLCLAGLIVVALNASYGNHQPVSASSADVELKYFTTEITTPSSPPTLALARHLQSIGAKMYGAFWCSHCLEQKEMFGREAAKLLNYVECFPNGYRKGIKIAKACSDANIEGFPTWVINGQVLSGELELSELARVSELKLEDSSPK